MSEAVLNEQKQPTKQTPVNNTTTDNSDKLPTASLPRRLMAMVYDSFIVVALSIAYGATATIVMYNFSSIDETTPYLPMHRGSWFQMGWALCIIVFYWFFWHTAGQTVGMKTWRLKLISKQTNGNPAHWQCLLRLVLAPISMSFFTLGYLWCLLDKNGAAVHDIVTRTRVVVTPKPAKSK
ncbi:MAG: putative RDD family membrane protein YckC [Lentisphaeria bacterium]